MIPLALSPRWWPWHLALVAVLVAFGWLGWWQLDSFADAGHRPVAADRVVAVGEVTAPGGRLAAGDVGRRVRAAGTWEADQQLVVPGRSHDGREGSLVVTPLRTPDGLLPVVRGFVAGEAAVPPPPAGEVAVTGVLQQSETEADATVGPTGVGAGQVAYVATVALLERLPYDADELYDGYVVLRSQEPPDPAAPERVQARDDGSSGGVARWRNLAYGLQWWLFAGAAVFFWGAVLRRAAQERHRSDAGSTGESAQTLAAPPRRT